MTQQVYTPRGARAMDKAAAEAAAAEAAVKQAEAAKAHVAVERERALLAQQLRREEAETRQAETAQRTREAEAARKAKVAEKTRKREGRRAARAALVGSLGARRALMVTVLVIGASMAIAWPAQASYFEAAGMGRAGLLAPIVIEGPTWLAAILVGHATAHQARTWVYRAATLLFASVAAGINFEHGSQTRAMLGIVYGLASLTGVAAWELYVHSARQAHSERTAAERRRAMQRRLSYPLVYRRAVRLSRATGMDIEQAWPMAWRTVHGADIGVTAEDLARQNQAMAKVAEAYDTRSVVTLPGAQLTAMHLAEAARTWQLDADRRPATSQVVPAIPPATRTVRKPRLPMPRGAKKAAADTARKHAADPVAAEQERIRAAQRFAAAKAAGTPLSYPQLAAEFGKSKEWARQAVLGHGGLHAAPAA
jgi:hypothetical protein